MRGLACALIVLLAAALAFPGTPVGDKPPDKGAKDPFLIDPPRRVGRITPACTEKQLIAIYGARNVRRARIHLGEGEYVEGTVLFPGTPNAVEIEWKRAFSHPKRITIAAARTRWRTKEGITIGTALSKLETANGLPVRLMGFGWDYEGRTVSWGKGRLPKELTVDLAPTRGVSTGEERAVRGGREFSSGHPSMQKMGLVVARLFVSWQ
jgi:hypothetical protein